MSATSEAITPDRIKLSDQVLEGLDNFDFTIPPDSVLEPVIEYDHHGRRVVDRWRLLLLLGPTGFGSLWHGRSLNSNQSVYIKLLPRASVMPLLNEIDHPNIIKPMRVFVPTSEDGTALPMVCVIYESIGAIPLSVLLMSPGPILRSEAAHILIMLVSALRHLHELQIAHGDINPDNVLLVLDEDRRAQLKIDTGRRLRKSTLHNCSTEHSKLPTPWLSPTSRNNAPNDVECFDDDLYGLGAIAFALLSRNSEFFSGANLADKCLDKSFAADKNFFSKHIKAAPFFGNLAFRLTVHTAEMSMKKIDKSFLLWKDFLSGRLSTKSIQATDTNQILIALSAHKDVPTGVLLLVIKWWKVWSLNWDVVKHLQSRPLLQLLQHILPMLRSQLNFPSLSAIRSQHSDAAAMSLLHRPGRKVMNLLRALMRNYQIIPVICHLLLSNDVIWTILSHMPSPPALYLVKGLLKCAPTAALMNHYGLEDLGNSFFRESHFEGMILLCSLPFGTTPLRPDYVKKLILHFGQSRVPSLPLSDFLSNRIDADVLLTSATVIDDDAVALFGKLIVDSIGDGSRSARFLPSLLPSLFASSRNELQAIQDCYLANCCSKHVFGFLPVMQMFAICLTCSNMPLDPRFVCLSCKRRCHAGHQFIGWRIKFRSACECEEGKCLDTSSDTHVFTPFPIFSSPTPRIGLAGDVSPGTIPHQTIFRRWAHLPAQSTVRFNYSPACVSKDDDDDTTPIIVLAALTGFKMPAASASPGSLFYFEIELLEVPTGDALAMGGSLQVGLSLSPISRGEVLGDPLACPPVGYVPGEYGYHGDDGSAFVGSYRGSPHLGPQYSVGDVVGCGVLNSGRVYFTLNGLFLDVVEGPVIPGMELHAAVSTSAGGAFRYRFQQPFLFQPPDLNAKVQWPFPLNSFALQLLANSPAFPSLLDSLDSLSHIAFWSLLAQHPAGDPSIDTHMSPSARETLAEALEKHPPTLFKRKFIEHQLIHAQSNRPLPAPSTRATPSDTAALQFHNLDEQFGAISQLQSELHSIQLRLRQAMSDCLISAESAAPSAANLLGPSMSASRDSLTRSQEFLFEDSDK